MSSSIYARPNYLTSEINPEDRVYAPNVENAFNYSQYALQDYFNQVQGAYTPINEYLGQDLTDYLAAVGPYQGYNWQNPLEFYESPEFTALQDYTRPDLERTTYTDPTIDPIQSIQPISDGIYGGQIAAAREGIAQQYADTRSQVEEQAYRSMTRPEQAAALLAELGVQQGAATQDARRQIQFEQAKQNLDLAQAEQQLNYNRSNQLANLNLQSEQAQATERQQAAQYLMGAEQYEEGQRQNQYQQDLSNAQYQAGLQQWYQEQQAAEAQSVYQSRYGLAQDMASTSMNQYETDRAAQYDYYNALLQGQQAASQQASQAATYETNLSEDERSAAREYAASQQSSPTTQYARVSSTSRPQTTTTTNRSTSQNQNQNRSSGGYS